MSLTTMQKTATTVVLVGVVLVGVGLVSYWSTKLAAGVLQPPDKDDDDKAPTTSQPPNKDDKTPTTSQPPTSPLLWDQTHGQFIQFVNDTTDTTVSYGNRHNDALLRLLMDEQYADEESSSGKIRVSRASAGSNRTRPWTRRPKRFIFRTVELNNTRLAHE